MTKVPKTILRLLLAGMLPGVLAGSPTPAPEGHVTQIFNDVKLLPAQADPRAAALNDKVDENTGLRTGDDSRSELTFGDLTITRLGANTVFSFNRAGRGVRLDSGAILLYVRKNSGAAEISTKAVSVGITGTTLIVETTANGDDKVIALEGAVRATLKDHLDQTSFIQGGQMLNIPSGADKIPKPVNVRIEELVKNYPLLAGFPPLPSQDLILAVVQGQNAPPPATVAESGPSKPTKKKQRPTTAPVVGQPVTQTGPSIWTGYPSGTVVYPRPRPRPRPGGPGQVGNPPGGNVLNPTPTPKPNKPKKKKKPGSGQTG